MFDVPSELDEKIQNHWKDSPRMQMKTIEELPELVGAPPMAGGGNGGGRGFSRHSNGSMRGNGGGGNNRNGGRSSKKIAGFE